MAEVKILIRKANIKDLKDILRLNFELFKKEYREFDKSLSLNWTYSRIGKEYFKDRIVKNDGFAEVAENKGRIIGYIVGGLSKGLSFRRKAQYAELENMLIEKKFRGRSLGTKLTKNFLNWCKRNKVNYVSVRASAQNKTAINFYKSLGLKEYDLILEKKLS